MAQTTTGQYVTFQMQVDPFIAALLIAERARTQSLLSR